MLVTTGRAIRFHVKPVRSSLLTGRRCQSTGKVVYFGLLTIKGTSAFAKVKGEMGRFMGAFKQLYANYKKVGEIKQKPSEDWTRKDFIFVHTTGKDIQVRDLTTLTQTQLNLQTQTQLFNSDQTHRVTHKLNSPTHQLTNSTHQLTNSAHQLTSSTHQLNSPTHNSAHQLNSRAHQLNSPTQLTTPLTLHSQTQLNAPQLTPFY